MNNLEIVNRIKKIADVTEDQELAKLFGVAKSTIFNWKKGTSIPLNQISEFAEKYDCDLNWLITGKSSEKLTTAEQMALTAFNALDDQKKIEAIAFMSGLGKSAVGLGGVSQQAGGSVQNMVAGDQTRK